jgi:hypothetical protein
MTERMSKNFEIKISKKSEEIQSSRDKDSDGSDESSEENLTCSLCANVYSFWHNLYQHYVTTHFRRQILQQRGIGPCHECGMNIKTERGVLLHYGISHNLIETFLEPEFLQPKDMSEESSIPSKDLRENKEGSDQLKSEWLEIDIDISEDDTPADEDDYLPFMISEPWSLSDDKTSPAI